MFQFELEPVLHLQDHPWRSEPYDLSRDLRSKRMTRVVLTALVAAALASFGIAARAETAINPPAATSQTKRVRLSWQEFVKDPQRVQWLRDGVAEMKRRNTASRDSAEYRTS